MTLPDNGLPDLPPALRAPSLRRRMACWIYEGMLMFGVVFAASYVFSVLTQTRHALENRHGQQAFLFVVAGLYFVWFWTRGTGQTLAMKTWHIRLVDTQGRPLTPARALLRYMLSWIWFLPPLALLAPWHLSAGEISLLMSGWVMVWALLSRFQRDQQFWHDVWAGTRLIDVQPDSARRR